MRTRAVLFTRRQDGWSCEITFTFASGRQFTDEMMTVQSAVYRWWLAAWWHARGSARLYFDVHVAKAGEREAKGWYD